MARRTRVFLSPERLSDIIPATSVTLDSRAAHHIARVLRLRTGDVVTLFDGQRGEFDAELTEVSKRTVAAEVLTHRRCNRESPLRVELGLALVRGERMDWAVQKAVELGVTLIQPLGTERGVVKITAERLARRMEHWRQIVIGACEQSGRTSIPTVELPRDLGAWLETLEPGGRRLVLQPGAVHQSPHHDLASNARVVLAIGPEGGWSAAEADEFSAHGFTPLTLGPRILRAETAVAAAALYAQLNWGDMAPTDPSPAV